MQVAFRCDASLQIGSGHVMRCLTLAEALRLRGHTCRFICRDLPGQMAERIESSGFAVTLLPAPDGGFVPGAKAPFHAQWAAVPWQTDATQTRAALAADCDWLVLDHYAFDAQWEKAVRPAAARIMVIDDLGDRSHMADLLLDQNLGRQAADYDGLLPDTAERLIGPRFALLRPEFEAARAQSLARRRACGFALRHLMIFLGGMDLPDVTGRALAALAADLPPSVRQITVVMGPSAPCLGSVQEQAKAMPIPTRVLVGVADMAALMAEADLAIGAAGGTAWERCVQGLPSLIVVLAHNQQEGAEALAKAGAAMLAGAAADAALGKSLCDAVARLSRDPIAMEAMSAYAAKVADGLGAARVAVAMETPVQLRRASMADAQTVWHWRQGLPQMAFRSGANTPLADHLTWFQHALSAADRRLFIATNNSIALGHLRLDLHAQGAATVSILLAPDARGKGLGLRLLARLADLARDEGLHHLVAEVHPSNASSHALFLAAGYAETGHANDYVHLSLPLRGLQTPDPRVI